MKEDAVSDQMKHQVGSLLQSGQNNKRSEQLLKHLASQAKKKKQGFNARLTAAMDKSVKKGPITVPKKLAREIRKSEASKERLVQRRID